MVGRHIIPRYAVLATVGVIGMASPAFAEGGVQRIACTGALICDVAGTCEEREVATTFVLSPLDVGRHGEGMYRIAYDDIETEAFMQSDFTLTWAKGQDDLQMLISLSRSQMLWVSRTPDHPEATAITFLTCKDSA